MSDSDHVISILNFLSAMLELIIPEHKKLFKKSRYFLISIFMALIAMPKKVLSKQCK